MKENRKVTDINVGDIEEILKKFSTSKRIKMYELLRIFKREGIENFVTTRKKYVDVILSDYKRVLKENEQLKNDIENMYDEEVVISIIEDNFNLCRNEVLEMLGSEE